MMAFIILMIIIAIIAMIVFVIAAIFYIIVMIAAAIGTIWGGGRALINYFKSFKENVIDDNRVTA
jgi:hypothetical protein